MGIVEVKNVYADAEGVHIEHLHAESYDYAALGCSLGVGVGTGFGGSLSDVWVDLKVRPIATVSGGIWDLHTFPWAEFCGTPKKLEKTFTVGFGVWRFLGTYEEWANLPMHFCDLSKFEREGPAYYIDVTMSDAHLEAAKQKLGLVEPPPGPEPEPPPGPEPEPPPGCPAGTTWPWPLCSVQDWFNDLWNHITSTVDNVVSKIWELVPDWIKDALNSISGLIFWLQHTVFEKIVWIEGQVANFSVFVANAVAENITIVSGWINSSATWVRDQLSSAINGVSAWIDTAREWVVTNVWNDIVWLSGQVSAGLDWVVTSVNNFVSEIGDTIGNIVNGISGVISDVINTGMGWVVDQLTAAYEASKEWFDTIVHGALSGVAEALGEGLKDLINWILGGLRDILQTLVGYVTGAITWFKDTFVNLLTDLTNQIREGLAAGSPPKDLEEAFVGLGKEWQESVLKQIEAATLSPVSPEQALGVATGIAGVGLGVTGLALALGTAADASHPVKEWGIRDATKVLLGYLGVSRTIAPIVTIPYDVGVLRPLTQYFESIYQTNIPGPGDLVRFAVREAWRPELQEGTPEFFINNMLRQGYSEMWSKYFWAAHWIIPTYTQAREAFWRGIISEEEFIALRKYADLAPAYDNVWEGLQYEMPTRIETRWLNEWGFINREEFRKLLANTGLHPAWVEKIADVYDKNQLRDELGRVRTALIALFKEGFMSETTLRSELSELGFRSDVVDMTVLDAKRDAELAEKRDYVKTYIEAFRKEKITENELIGFLQELKVETWRQNAIIDFERARVKVEAS